MPRGNRSSASSENSNSSVATPDLATAIGNLQAARNAQAEAEQAAIAAIMANRDQLIAQREAIENSIAEADAILESSGVAPAARRGRPRKNASTGTARRGRPRKNAAEGSTKSGKTGRPRGSSNQALTLPNAILVSMNQYESGSQFGIAEVQAAVVDAPCNYVFSGSEDGQRVMISQSLGALVNQKMVKRIERGVYVLTSAGSKAADEIAAAPAEAAETAS